MNIDYNSHCYIFKKLQYKNGFLNIDATYIIHLKGNERLNHIYNQLREYQPTKIVYIVFNEGFKKCDKQLIENVSYNDLTDAFLQCFKHANENNYENILILEDDFIFSPEIKNKNNLQNINNFIISKQNEDFIYYLGCNPILIIPYNFTQYRVIKSCSMHAVIYSRKAREKCIHTELKHWDIIIEKSIPTRYMYYKPLCYQTYPDTENKLSWHEKDNKFIFNIKNGIIKMLALDKQPEPGFTIIYSVAKFINLLFLLIFIIIIVNFIKS